MNLQTCSVEIDETLEQDHEIKNVERQPLVLFLVNNRTKNFTFEQTQKVMIEGKITVSF